MSTTIRSLLKSRSAQLGVLKVLELGLLSCLAYYAATRAANAEVWVFVVLYALLFLVWIVSFRLTRAIRPSLDLLLRHFHHQMGFDAQADVRVTIHRKLSETHYEQFVDYYPHGAKRGRKHEIKKGLVKFAFQGAQGQFSENFTDPQRKHELLVSKYNFRANEATAQLNDGEMSYYCSPIMDDGRIWGVLYMNAKLPGTFDTADSNLSRAVRVLVRFVEDEVA